MPDLDGEIGDLTRNDLIQLLREVKLPDSPKVVDFFREVIPCETAYGYKVTYILPLIYLKSNPVSPTIDLKTYVNTYQENVTTLLTDLYLREEEVVRPYIFWLLTRISNREAKVINLRFGLTSEQSLRLQDVAEEFKRSKERVRQIEAYGLRKVRDIAYFGLSPKATAISKHLSDIRINLYNRIIRNRSEEVAQLSLCILSTLPCLSKYVDELLWEEERTYNQNVSLIPIQLTNEEEQWLTGFWEGDGHLSTQGVSLTQKDRRILEYIQNLLNGAGRIIKCNSKTPAGKPTIFYQMSFRNMYTSQFVEVFARTRKARTPRNSKKS